MNVESKQRSRRARLHAALGDPARLAVVELLVTGDASPGELARELGVASNLLAHHLGVLEDVGLVRRTRSEGDGRRSYVRLDTVTLADLDLRPAAPVHPPRVLFVCSHNSARSQLADAAWRRASGVTSASAGTRPAAKVDPRAVAVGRRHGLSLARARTHRVDDVLRPTDLVVAVCDAAHEELTARGTARLHWSIPDPVRRGTDAAFEDAYREIEDRVVRLAATVDPTTGSAS